MMHTYEIEISGMGCMNCVRSVTAALEGCGAEVDGCEIGHAKARFDGEKDALRAAIEDRGFDVVSITEG